MIAHLAQILTAVAAMCVVCSLSFEGKAQTVSVKTANDAVIRKRIAAIFSETLKRGESRIEHDGHPWLTIRTFIPPSTDSVDEIRLYGDAAIPVLAEYLDKDSGFEKHLALRFLGSIRDAGIVEPLSRVALKDPSSGFRLVALMWLAESPWDLALPVIRQVAENETSPEVREKAKEILTEHVPR